jgi:hypothetical protein
VSASRRTRLISCALALLPFRSVTSSYGQLGSKAVAACSAIVPGAPNQRADLPYFKPHGFRMTLALLGERINVAQLAVHVRFAFHRGRDSCRKIELRSYRGAPNQHEDEFVSELQ